METVLGDKFYFSLCKLSSSLVNLPETDQLKCMHRTNALLDSMFENDSEAFQSRLNEFKDLTIHFENHAAKLKQHSGVYKKIAAQMAGIGLMVLIGTFFTAAATVIPVSAFALMSVGYGIYLYDLISNTPKIDKIDSVINSMQSLFDSSKPDLLSKPETSSQTNTNAQRKEEPTKASFDNACSNLLKWVEKRISLQSGLFKGQSPRDLGALKASIKEMQQSDKPQTKLNDIYKKLEQMGLKGAFKHENKADIKIINAYRESQNSAQHASLKMS